MKTYMIPFEVGVHPFSVYNEKELKYHNKVYTKVPWYFTEEDIRKKDRGYAGNSKVSEPFWFINLPNPYILTTGEAIKGFAVRERRIIEVI